MLGFLSFCIGATQVYSHKLARKGAVTGGIYNLTETDINPGSFEQSLSS